MLVLPSLSEGRPNVVLEALSCEVPVVATDVGGIPEIMTEGETGYLVPAKNPEKLSEKINKLLEDESRREKNGKIRTHEHNPARAYMGSPCKENGRHILRTYLKPFKIQAFRCL